MLMNWLSARRAWFAVFCAARSERRARVRALAQIARGVAREAAFGFDGAVRRAEQAAEQTDGDEASALAALGTLSSLTPLLPMLVAVALVAFLLCAVPLAWALWRLRQLSREHAELRSQPRERAPASERSAYVG
jgi:hypothetical protein